MTVLDASAVLALINDEPGADAVAQAVPGSSLGAANLAEIVGKLVDVGTDARPLRQLLDAAEVTVVPVTADDAEVAGALRALPGGRSLSLGDRCALALTLRSDPPEVLTADRAWVDLGLPIRVRLVR